MALLHEFANARRLPGLSVLNPTGFLHCSFSLACLFSCIQRIVAIECRKYSLLCASGIDVSLVGGWRKWVCPRNVDNSWNNTKIRRGPRLAA